MTAVEYIKKRIEEDSDTSFLNIDWNKFDEIINQAKELEKEQIVEEKIELIKSIGNQGKNAPLYGILKKTLLELHKQYNEIRTRCLN